MEKYEGKGITTESIERDYEEKLRVLVEDFKIKLIELGVSDDALFSDITNLLNSPWEGSVQDFELAFKKEIDKIKDALANISDLYIGHLNNIEKINKDALNAFVELWRERENEIRRYMELKDNEYKQIIEEQQRMAEEYKRQLEDSEEKNRRLVVQIGAIRSMNELNDEIYSARGIDQSNIEKFRVLLNGEIDLEKESEKSLDQLSRSENFQDFPVPTEQDVGYAVFYNKVLKMRQAILLAQRFEITSKAQLGDVEFNLHGARPQVTVPEMSRSFSKFVKSGAGEDLLGNLEKMGCSDLSERELSEILSQVANDVSQSIISFDEESIIRHVRYDEVMLLAPIIKTGPQMYHGFSLSIYKNICLITDKSQSDNPGMMVYLIPNDVKLEGLKKEIAEESAKSMVTRPVEINQQKDFTAKMVKRLKLKKMDYIPLTTQYGQNCAWSSCAKSVLLSALYFRLYDAAKKTPAIEKLSGQAQEMAAHAFAKKYARAIHKKWSRDDKYEALKAYIEQLNEDDKARRGPGSMVLACIYLKYTQRLDGEEKARIFELIENANIVTEDDLLKAKASLLENATKMIKDESPVLYAVFEKDMNAIAERSAELYLVAGKKKVTEVYKTLFSLSLSPFKDAIKKLDTAIAEARSKNALSGKASFFKGAINTDFEQVDDQRPEKKY